MVLSGVTSPAAVVLQVNGKEVALEAALSLDALVRSLGRDPRSVALERNGVIVRRAQFGEVRVAAGDVIEIVQFVQGG